jgi:hypothetical protein
VLRASCQWPTSPADWEKGDPTLQATLSRAKKKQKVQIHIKTKRRDGTKRCSGQSPWCPGREPADWKGTRNTSAHKISQDQKTSTHKSQVTSHKTDEAEIGSTVKINQGHKGALRGWAVSTNKALQTGKKQHQPCTSEKERHTAGTGTNTGKVRERTAATRIMSIAIQG